MFHKTLFLFLVLCLLALIPASLAQDFDNPACSIETFTMSPSYGAVPQGTHIDLHGRGNCDGGVRAVRFEVHGIPKAEIGSNEQWETFKTEEFSLGTGLVCFAVAGGNNTSWLAAERRCFTVTIEAADSSSGGQTGSPTGQGNNSGYEGGMDVSGWCISQGYFGSATGSDAYSWYCYNSNGSYGRSIDVDSVCAYSSGGSHPYAGLTDESNPYAWYCATTPQGRPSENGGNPEQQNVQPTQAPATSGESNSGSCSFAPLSAGDRGRVTAGLDNRVRTGPDTDYQYLTSISEYTPFDVLSGPYAGSGYCWYEIRLDNGTVGYTAAGTYSDPWLEFIGGSSSDDGGYDLNPPLPEISSLEPPYDLEAAAATLEGILDLPYDDILENVQWYFERLSTCGIVAFKARQVIYFVAASAAVAEGSAVIYRNPATISIIINYVGTEILAGYLEEVQQCAGYVISDLLNFIAEHVR